jgi:short-subunit dehydrogenase
MTRNILITGASSGLGEALALAYAASDVRLFLSGRDDLRLNEVAASCRAKGATVKPAIVDVTNAIQMAAWVAGIDRESPLDVVIANAGISGGTGRTGAEPAEQTRQIFATNIDGVVNTVLPTIDAMRSRRRGQIAIVASLAGFRGLPSAPAYCASKAAVRVWGEGLRGALAKEGIGVTVICPGFVKTPMTAVNRFPMPFLMPAEKAGDLMRRGIDANRARLAFPWPTAATAWLLAALPPGWIDRLLRRLPAKE